VNCTRRLTFSAGHRVLGHEGKCQFPHGHNYAAEITAEAIRLDPIGRVVDFSVIKRVVGEWIEQNWDHAFLVNTEDTELLEVFAHHPKWKLAVLPYNPDCGEYGEGVASRRRGTDREIPGARPRNTRAALGNGELLG